MIMTSRVPILVTILGATGTGKSKLAIELAQKYMGQIISADSMQVYKGLDVITAKVTKEEQAMAPHHMLDIIDPLSTFTVVDFRNRALPIIEHLIRNEKLPIIVGGTNYYIESLLWQVLVDDQKNVNDIACNSADGSSCSYNDTSLVFDRDGGYVKLFCDNEMSTNDRQNDQQKYENSDDNKRDGKEDEDDRQPPYKKVKFDDLITNQELHDKLKEIDPESAARLHPNNRRKILRSLQVFEQTGKKHSDILREQRMAGGSGLGGPLRFENSVILWLQCDKEALDERLNRRVDSMIELGLVQELLDFHERYNEERLKSNALPDYTKGIFQSIGFKEFHDYLILDKEDKKSDKGKKLLEFGIENLKLRTRRYARRQHRWVTNRFVKRFDRQVPQVYSLDTTNLSKWKDDVYQAAVSIIDDKMSGKIPNRKSLNCNNYYDNNVDDDDDDDDDDDGDDNNGEDDRDSDKKEIHKKTENKLSLLFNSENDNERSNFCETCQRVFIGQFQWNAHLRGRKHQKMVKRVNMRKKLEEKKEEEEQQQQ